MEPLHDLKWRDVGPRELRELIRNSTFVLMWADLAKAQGMSPVGCYVRVVKKALLAEVVDWPANVFTTIAVERSMLYIAQKHGG